MNSLLAQRLARIIVCYWRLPRDEGERLLSVLLRSPCSRVVTLRQQLSVAEVATPTVQGLREPDLTHVFAHIITPVFMMQVLGDLGATRSLPIRQVRQIEHAILETVDRDGHWRAV